MPYTVLIRVLPVDIDELGHASNIVYLRWVQDAAVAHSTAVGLGPGAYRERGQSFVVTRHEIDYLRPALVGDELAVETRVTVLGAASSERRTAIKRGDVVVARAITKWAFIDLKRGRPVRIPDEIRRLF